MAWASSSCVHPRASRAVLISAPVILVGKIILAGCNVKPFLGPRLIAGHSFASIPALCTLLEAQYARRGFGPFVFPGRAQHQMDRTALQKAWRTACRAVGCPAALIHDLRRTAVRDMRRAGVGLPAVMKMVGWETTAMLRRYAIADETMLREAGAKLARLPR